MSLMKRAAAPAAEKSSSGARALDPVGARTDKVQMSLKSNAACVRTREQPTPPVGPRTCGPSSTGAQVQIEVRAAAILLLHRQVVIRSKYHLS